MKRRLAVLLLGLLLLAACTSGDYAVDEVELTLPTQAESDAAAAQRIHRDNEQAEFDKLAQEIGD
jgi:hypothetical protein